MTISNKRFAMISAIGLLGLAATACDTATKDAAANTAEAIEGTADAMRNQSDNIAEAIENKTTGAREEANMTANEIGNRADAVVKAAKGK